MDKNIYSVQGALYQTEQAAAFLIEFAKNTKGGHEALRKWGATRPNYVKGIPSRQKPKNG